MPKVKTHKGLSKRIRVSATGKVRYRRPWGSHLMSGKSGDRCRRLRRPAILVGAIAKRIKEALNQS